MKTITVVLPDFELDRAIYDFKPKTWAMDILKAREGSICMYLIKEAPFRETSNTSTKEVHVLTSNGFMQPKNLVPIKDFFYTMGRPDDIEFEILGDL